MTKKVEWHGSIPKEAKSWLTFSNQSDKGYEYNKYFTEITASTDDNGGSITDEIKFNVAKNNTLLNRSATVFFKQRGGKTATYKVMQKAPHELTPTGNESAYTYVETVSITPDDQSCKYNETQYQFKASYTAIPKIAKEYFWPDEGMSSAYYDTEHLTDGTPINDTDVFNFDWEKVSDGDDWTIKDGKITFPVNKDKDNTRTFKVRGTYKNHISNSSGNYSDEGSIIQEKNGDVYHYKIDISPSNSYTWKWDEVDERSFTIESYYTLNDETTKHNVDFSVDTDTSNDFDWRKDGSIIYAKPTGTNVDSVNQKKASFNVKNSGDTITISLTQNTNDVKHYKYRLTVTPTSLDWPSDKFGSGNTKSFSANSEYIEFLNGQESSASWVKCPYELNPKSVTDFNILDDKDNCIIYAYPKNSGQEKDITESFIVSQINQGQGGVNDDDPKSQEVTLIQYASNNYTYHYSISPEMPQFYGFPTNPCAIINNNGTFFRYHVEVYSYKSNQKEKIPVPYTLRTSIYSQPIDTLSLNNKRFVPTDAGVQSHEISNSVANSGITDAWYDITLAQEESNKESETRPSMIMQLGTYKFEISSKLEEKNNYLASLLSVPSSGLSEEVKYQVISKDDKGNDVGFTLQYTSGYVSATTNGNNEVDIHCKPNTDSIEKTYDLLLIQNNSNNTREIVVKLAGKPTTSNEKENDGSE